MTIFYNKQTNKLFFGKYVYKVALETAFATYFRSRQLDNIKSRLESEWLAAQQAGESRMKVGAKYIWRESSWADEHDVRAVQALIDQLEDLENYTLRIEGRRLGVYFNDESYIEKITAIPGIQIKEIAQPKDPRTRDYLLSTPKVIIRKDYTHKYKVTVNSLLDQGDNFKQWAQKISKIKLSSSDFRYEGHFYVADEKTLDLCRIFLGDRLRKVEQLVTSKEI
jgi:hypothetical protein